MKQVTDTGAIEKAVDDLIAANPDPMLRMTKQLLAENAVESDLAAVQRREIEMLRVCYQTPEHKEAIAAFMEKRPARFR